MGLHKSDLNYRMAIQDEYNLTLTQCLSWGNFTTEKESSPWNNLPLLTKEELIEYYSRSLSECLP